MLKSSLCDYSDACMLVKGTIAITLDGDSAAARQTNEKKNKEVKIKNCAPVIECITEINDTPIGNAKDINVVMLMYDLIDYTDSYSKHL